MRDAKAPHFSNLPEPAPARLDVAGVEYTEASGTSIYFKDPDGVRLELLADPLGEMYGTKVL